MRVWEYLLYVIMWNCSFCIVSLSVNSFEFSEVNIELVGIASILAALIQDNTRHTTKGDE